MALLFLDLWYLQELAGFRRPEIFRAARRSPGLEVAFRSSSHVRDLQVSHACSSRQVACPEGLALAKHMGAAMSEVGRNWPGIGHRAKEGLEEARMGCFTRFACLGSSSGNLRGTIPCFGLLCGRYPHARVNLLGKIPIHVFLCKVRPHKAQGAWLATENPGRLARTPDLWSTRSPSSPLPFFGGRVPLLK